MHLHNCRCFREHLRMLLQSLRALRKAPAGPGSVRKYSEALVKATGVSWRFTCSFRTNLHLLMNPMNAFRRMVTVGQYATVFVYNMIPTEWEETAKLRSEGDMQRDAWYWCWVQNNLPPWSLPALMERIHSDPAIPPRWKCFLLMSILANDLVCPLLFNNQYSHATAQLSLIIFLWL